MEMRPIYLPQRNGQTEGRTHTSFLLERTILGTKKSCGPQNLQHRGKKDTKTKRSRLEVKETCTKNSSGNADTIYGIQFAGNLCLVIRIAPGVLS